MPRGRAIDEAWLRERYPRMTDIDALLDDCEREFGWRPSRRSIYVKANSMGLRKEPVAGRADRAERTIRWSKEPELEAWMLEHDRGQRMDDLQAEWRERFGFGISRGQVNLFRASHGTQRRNSHGGGRPRVPVGAERESKDGYIVVKVRPEASVPMSKDNWRLKHVHEYEKAHGAVPDGCVVYFADGDRRNFDASNLVAVPRRLVGIMNGPSMPRWHDAESLQACIALAELKSAQASVMARSVRTCGVCGRRFVPDAAHVAIGNTGIRTCPACLAAGRKASRWTRNGEQMRDEPDWKAIEGQLMGLTLAQLKPLRSTVFRGCLGGASSKASVVGEMVSNMQHWWRYAPRYADEALDAIAETLEAL